MVWCMILYIADFEPINFETNSWSGWVILAKVQDGKVRLEMYYYRELLLLHVKIKGYDIILLYIWGAVMILFLQFEIKSGRNGGN